MAVLERDGYLQQPHTSAGRIPTDRGYRFKDPFFALYLKKVVASPSPDLDLVS